MLDFSVQFQLKVKCEFSFRVTLGSYFCYNVLKRGKYLEVTTMSNVIPFRTREQIEKDRRERERIRN